MKLLKLGVLVACLLCASVASSSAQAAVGYTLGLFAPGSVVGGSTTAVPIKSVVYVADTLGSSVNTGANTLSAVNASTVICGITPPANWPSPINNGGTFTLTVASVGRVVIAWADMSNLPTSASKICAVDIGPSLDFWKASLPPGQIIPWSINAVDTAGFVSPWANNGTPSFFSSAPPPAPVNLIIFSR